jgi:hypothetical protein
VPTPIFWRCVAANFHNHHNHHHHHHHNHPPRRNFNDSK